MPTPSQVTATVSSHPFHDACIVVPADDDSDGPYILLSVGVEHPVLLSQAQLAAIAAAASQVAAVA